MIETDPTVDPVQRFKQILENRVISEPLPIAPWLYFNREISLLNFQARVLEEAQDPNNPVLERVKFLSIFGSNMDEFFMVRVSRMRKQVEENAQEITPDGLTAREELTAIRKRVIELMKEAQSGYIPLLANLLKNGIRILDFKELTEKQLLKVNEYFQNTIFPVLIPLALDSSHPFPHISSLSLNLAVMMHDKNGLNKFVRVKVPADLPALMLLKCSPGHGKKGTSKSRYSYIWLEQVILANLKHLFPGMKAIRAYPFRIIRNTDFDLQEDETEDLLESMQQRLQQQKFGATVMVSIHKSMPRKVRTILMENLEITAENIFVIKSPLELTGLRQIYQTADRPDLKFPAYTAVIPIPLRNRDAGPGIFEAIRGGDILLHHPYDSFIPVVDFLHAAAIDPGVLAIKQTLYRVGQNSPVIEALIEAAEHGKQVAILVELKARFDEGSNIEWARKLTRSGAHVIYGIRGLKTHMKAGLVVRKEEGGLRSYLHLATGNYNSVTAQIYEDIGLFTCDETLISDVTHLFNYLTGYSNIQAYQKLIVAPFNLRQRLQDLILQEMEYARSGQKGHIILKANSLVDPQIIRQLYEASQAGVRIDLAIRGICCLVPGVPNLSENIRVISVVGRFLEHSRIFYFYNNGDEKVFLGSADLMTRNLNYRVETVFPIEDERHIRYIRDQVLEKIFQDNCSARTLQPDGTYLRKQSITDEASINMQNWLIQHPHGNLLS